ncbi:hypothetical protein J6T93_04840 [bacterium]|nr:hypothetical protein [bacterium]
MRLPKFVFLPVCLAMLLSSLASGALREAGAAYSGSAQTSVSKGGLPTSTGPAFETYCKLYLTPEPAAAALLAGLFALWRRNR